MSKHKTELREIQKKDLAICAEIFSRTFSNTPWNENWNTDSALERISHFYDSKGFCGVVAEEDGVLGFVLGNIEPYFTGPIFYLREMCTDPAYQNSGIGSMLLTRLENTLASKGVKSIYLITEHNIPAEQFYMKRGYKVDENTGSFSKAISS
jgi:ribosomal protein S18 acetylase RimI-like enzyme